MRMKAVYVVVSSFTDNYFEQAWVSAWSLRYHNPGMPVWFVTDAATYEQVHASWRKNACEVVDKMLKVDTVPSGLSKMAISRWIKTSLRNLLEGDYLFIDSDTVVCGPLNELEGLEGDVLMVPDSHGCVSEDPQQKYTARSIRRLFHREWEADYYFNSGVIVAKDTPKTRQFYSQWHENWKRSLAKGSAVDQLALAVTVMDNPAVTLLDGIYNCQVRRSIRFLCQARIIHFFTKHSVHSLIHPFAGTEVYEEVKRRGRLTEEFRQQVLKVKSLFPVHSYVMSGQEFEIRYSASYIFLKYMKERHSFFYGVMNKLSCILHVFIRLVD